MWAWPRRARGLLGLGLAGGVIGALLATVFGVFEILLRGWSDQWAWLPVYSFIGFTLGAVAGAGFAVLLSATSSQLTLAEIGWKRAAVLGGVAGALFPTMGAMAMSTAGPPVASGVIFAGASGLVGAGAAVALLRIAQRVVESSSPGEGPRSGPP